jgi:hypothetical protein
MLTILIILLLYFIFDILQYIFGAIDHKKAGDKYDKELFNRNLTPDKIIKYDEDVKRAEVFYILKLVFLSISSILLITQIIILMYGC